MQSILGRVAGSKKHPVFQISLLNTLKNNHLSKYYCLIAGLPEIRSEEYKLLYNLGEFKEILKENLDRKDFDLVMLFYRKFDNINLLNFLNSSGYQFDTRGSITTEMFAELLRQLKEQEIQKDARFPDYFREFIPAFLSDLPIFSGIKWEDQLTTLYFDASGKCKNRFISDWFGFNLAITNILTAINCRNYSIDMTGAIVGTNELAETIRYSTAKDFEISPLFPFLDEVMRISEETDILEREKKIDLLKWSWIEERTFHYNFSIENIFAYLLQTEILERWINLNPDNGSKVFKEFISRLRGSFQFPEEYKLNK